MVADPMVDMATKTVNDVGSSLRFKQKRYTTAASVRNDNYPQMSNSGIGFILEISGTLESHKGTVSCLAYDFIPLDTASPIANIKADMVFLERLK